MTTLLMSPEMFGGEGGVARMMRLYLKALCENDPAPGSVTSVALNDAADPDPRLAHYSTQALKRHVGCSRRKPAFVRETLRASRRVDRIVCGHLHQLPVAWMANAFNRRLQYFAIAHGIDVWRPYSKLEQRALLSARRILCVSSYTRDRMLEHLPTLKPENLVVVPNTLDPQLAAAARAGSVGGTEKTIGSRDAGAPLRILSVGRLRKVDIEKGFETMVDALPLIRREFPSAELRVIGTGDDLERLRDRAATLGGAHACTFTGVVNDEALAAEYAFCDIFALPSRKEGFGLVYLEAMTRGKPCIGVNAGGVPEVVNDSVGALVEYGNPAAIAAAVAELVRHPRDPAAIRAHADRFAFPEFKRRVAAALS